MAILECGLCGYIYDEAQQGVAWDALPDSELCTTSSEISNHTDIDHV